MYIAFKYIAFICLVIYFKKCGVPKFIRKIICKNNKILAICRTKESQISNETSSKKTKRYRYFFTLSKSTS